MKKCLFFLSLLTFLSCSNESARTPQEMIVGKWEVFRVQRDGEDIGGGRFKGSYYTFDAEGRALAISPMGDTVTSRYELHGDTLTYIGDRIREDYRLDSLNEKRLQLSHANDGIATVLNMVKVTD